MNGGEEKTYPIEWLYDHLKQLRWPVQKTDSALIISNKKFDPITILEIDGEKFNLAFVWYRRLNSSYGKVSEFELSFDGSVNIREIVYLNSGGYRLSYGNQIKSILLRNNEINRIDINSSVRRLTLDATSKSLKIPPSKYKDVLEDAATAFKRSQSYKNSVERYLTNEFAKKHLSIEIQSTTTTEQGEFEFLINRFNLKTKQASKDFKKYLNNSDIKSLQELFQSLLKKEIFSPEYIWQLDDYFIREKLKNIIKLGRDLLALKSYDLKTAKAKLINKRISEGKISQLETLWQKYFEKYLLFLIFSYKEIYPKIKLKLDGSRKLPDFIGINHYYGVDAIEIKTHLTPALVWDGSHKNYSFSPELSKAIIQTMNYLDAIKRERFKNDEEKLKITSTTHKENLYRPRGIIIISSRDRLVKSIKDNTEELIRRDFTKLRNSLRDIEILTFDEIIEIADSYQRNIADKSNRF